MEITKIPKTKERNIYTEKLNVAAYVRVSTKSEKQHTSFESQYNYYKNKIEKNINWNFVGIYADEGISGTRTKNRDAFLKLIKDSEIGKIDLILIKSISRFARNTVDSLNYIRKLKNINVGIIFEEEHINTLHMTSELLLSIYSSIAQMESNNTSSRVSYGIEMRVKNGEYNMAKESYGYKIGKNNNILIKPNEAKVIRLIFDMCINDYSIASIVKYLNDNNIKKSGSTWNYQKVCYILNNEKYTGSYLYGRSNSAQNQLNVNRNDYLLIKDVVPAIISKETFIKSHEKSKSRFLGNYNYKVRNELIGLFKCGYCGGSIGFMKHPNKNYLFCGNRFNKCGLGHLNYNLMVKTVNSIYNSILNYKFDNKRINKINSKIRKNKFNMNNLENKIQQSLELYMERKLSKLDFDKLQEDISNKIFELQKVIINLENEKEYIRRYKKYIEEIQILIIKNHKEEFNVDLFKKIFSFAVIGNIASNNRRTFNYVRFIANKNINSEEIKKDLIFNNKFEVLIDKRIKCNSFNMINNRRKHFNNIRITFEVMIEE